MSTSRDRQVLDAVIAGVNPAPASFAISVPVRTGVAWLPEALKSLAMQTVPLKVALLDVSDDPVVAATADRYREMIRYAYHRSADDGQAAAIQVGWEALDADLYSWLNADDRLMPEALAKVAKAFAANPEVDVVYGHALLLDAEGAFISYFPTVTHGLDALPWSNVICQPACFVRREALAKVGGLDTRLHYVMDWDLWLRLRDAGCKFLFLDQVLAAVIAHADTKTIKGGEDRFAEIDACLRTRFGARKRLASLLRHRVYGAHKHVGWLVSLGLRGLALLLDPAGRGGGGGVIAGIRVCSGRVSRVCRVPMPWYDVEPPRRLVIAARPAGEYRVRCNGSELSVSREPMGTVLSFELAPAARRLYDIEIIGARRNWYLKGIRLLHRANDHGSKPNPD